MKKYKLHCIIPLVVYPFDIMVSFGQTDLELQKILRSKGIESDEDEQWQLAKITGIGRTCVFKTGGTLLRLKSFPETAFDYGVLNHEIFHAVSYIMHKIGMPLEIGISDEAYAYLIGYITEQIFIEIRKMLIK